MAHSPAVRRLTTLTLVTAAAGAAAGLFPAPALADSIIYGDPPQHLALYFKPTTVRAGGRTTLELTTDLLVTTGNIDPTYFASLISGPDGDPFPSWLKLSGCTNIPSTQQDYCNVDLPKVKEKPETGGVRVYYKLVMPVTVAADAPAGGTAKLMWDNSGPGPKDELKIVKPPPPTSPPAPTTRPPAPTTSTTPPLPVTGTAAGRTLVWLVAGALTLITTGLALGRAARSRRDND
ncbi:hypothetical protein Afil01_19900 [Actinorhabdospora filicis]|uniref:LPXTG-motif cell wall anchor domain-containing protein n=1 Tax=Actinorhabdospora filicis TaxID=1785913 RepID=A0A9W6W8P3_9ACTN|nr:hypothetical protein [Actinorhabdospora filicis]GLZ77183.1 hypothetical protein Afil01_19900 [Actinorhabdospora filicis]